jgi:hypothetical protein
MTYKNTYRYIDVLPKFVMGYNDTVHSTTGMAPSKVTDSDILKIWNKMWTRHSSIRSAPVKFKLGQHVRINKEKFKFAKGGEQNTKCRVQNCKTCVELADLLGKHIEGQFYAEELSPAIVTKNTVCPIDIIRRKRVRKGSIEFLVRWTGYSPNSDTWISAKALKKHGVRQ